MSSNKINNTGVYEWADESENMQIGCENGCRYCFARHRAVNRFGYCKSNEAWLKPVINKKKVNKQYRKNVGTVMFPSTHDITPLNIHDYLQVATKLLNAGNNLLIVSKPDFKCIEKLCFELSVFDKSKILFRFTIGSTNDFVLKFWEPNAPDFEERFKCLKYAYHAGYKTSVSCEPFLDFDPWAVYEVCKSYLTDSFWIGKMRMLASRVNLQDITPDEHELYVKPLERIYSDDFIINQVYRKLNDQPFIKWKDSIREVVETVAMTRQLEGKN